ncbi:hypothetical protein, partial [Yoonia sp.]|uniref:hypothetical protein n=1 Tax=Yoonia sp. TaxID=2212373 RepID=UPI003267868B
RMVFGLSWAIAVPVSSKPQARGAKMRIVCLLKLVTSIQTQRSESFPVLNRLGRETLTLLSFEKGALFSS